MSKLSNIRQRAAEIAGRGDDDNLGPDRGTMDQEQARVERAKQEARREAERERVQQRASDARERERERVLSDDDGGDGLVSSIASTINNAADAVDDGDDQRLDDVSRAMGSDFDGDGETLADEFGLQSAARGDAEDAALSGLSTQVDRNTGRLGDLEDQFPVEDAGGVGAPPQNTGRSGGQFEPPSGLGGPPQGRGSSGGQTGAGFGFGDIDPEDFGFGGGNDSDGGFFGGGGDP